MASKVRLFSTGDGEHWIAARNRGEACRFLVSEYGYGPGDDVVCGTKEIPEADWPKMFVDVEGYPHRMPVDAQLAEAASKNKMPFRFAGVDY